MLLLLQENFQLENLNLRFSRYALLYLPKKSLGFYLTLNGSNDLLILKLFINHPASLVMRWIFSEYSLSIMQRIRKSSASDCIGRLQYSVKPRKRASGHFKWVHQLTRIRSDMIAKWADPSAQCPPKWVRLQCDYGDVNPGHLVAFA